MHKYKQPLACLLINIKDSIRKGEDKQIRSAVEDLLLQIQNDAGSELLVLDERTKRPQVEFVTIGGSLESVLKEAGNWFKEKKTEDLPGICLVILPNNTNDANKIYSFIKRLGDVECGFNTICLTKSNLLMSGKGRERTVRANLALKFNIKAKGLNHQVLRKSSKGKGSLNPIIDDTTMIAGYDIIHPTGAIPMKSASPGDAQTQEKKSDKDDTLPPSFVGLVASVSKDLNQWPAIAWKNPSRQELLTSPELRDNFGSRLEVWMEKHNRMLPKHIIIYRDGVSEGQYKDVLETEVAAIQDACKAKARENSDQPCPKILFIIATKRHRTRFYFKPDYKDATNPPNGLVVDNNVTMSRHWDFFLQPHTTRKGKRTLCSQKCTLIEHIRHHGTSGPLRRVVRRILAERTHHKNKSIH